MGKFNFNQARAGNMASQRAAVDMREQELRRPAPLQQPKPKIKNYHGYERARQRVPDLVPEDPTVWNKINEQAFNGIGLKLGPKAKRGSSASGKSSDAALNASVTVDGVEIPVLVAPHAKFPNKWHLITVRDRGWNNNDFSVLGGRHYNKGGPIYRGIGDWIGWGSKKADDAARRVDDVADYNKARKAKGAANTVQASKEALRKQWLKANKHKRGAVMPRELRDDISLDDFAAPADLITDFVPGVGEAKDFYRAGADLAAGNYGSAAVNAGAGLLGVVPGVGDLAGKGLKVAASPFVKGAKAVRNAAVDDLAARALKRQIATDYGVDAPLSSIKHARVKESDLDILKDYSSQVGPLAQRGKRKTGHKWGEYSGELNPSTHLKGRLNNLDWDLQNRVKDVQRNELPPEMRPGPLANSKLGPDTKKAWKEARSEQATRDRLAREAAMRREAERQANAGQFQNPDPSDYTPSSGPSEAEIRRKIERDMKRDERAKTYRNEVDNKYTRGTKYVKPLTKDIDATLQRGREIKKSYDDAKKTAAKVNKWLGG